jgi:peptidoglycan/xylan/chitin deacetylase (PgdA/CDA1 family)
MLLILLYHRIGEGKHATPLENFINHMEYISSNYNCVLPGDPLKEKTLNVCLTFDDAFVDIYHHVFPLLQRLNLKAMMAVPTQFIIEDTQESVTSRISIPYYEADKNYNKAPFCTWKEIKEMVEAGVIEVASHSHTHCNMEETNDYEKELLLSKKILESNLNQYVSSFIYPYGRFSPKTDQTIKNIYPYTMRIGNGMNFSWTPKKTPLLRVCADGVTDFKKIVSKIPSYKFKAYTNALRYSLFA